MKSAILFICIAILSSITSCTLTPAQQNAAVKIANVAVSRLDKNNKVTPAEREIIKLGVLAATSPKDRNTDTLIANASNILNALVARGAIDQKSADDIDAVLALASLVF